MLRQRKQNNRRGAVVVEMALVLPIFVMIVLGIVEFGRAMMVSQLVTNAARDGVRKAIITGSTNSSVQTSIASFMQTAVGVSSSDVTTTITITPGAGNTDPGNQLANAKASDLVNIEVKVPFTKVSFIKGNYLEGKNLVGRAAMRHE